MRGRVRELVVESDRASVQLDVISTQATFLHDATGRMAEASIEQTELAKQLVGTTADTAQRMERLVHAARQQSSAAERLDASSASLRDAVATVATHAQKQERLASGIAASALKGATSLRALGEVATSGVVSSHAARQANAQMVAVSTRHELDIASFGTTVETIAGEASSLVTELARFRLPR